MSTIILNSVLLLIVLIQMAYFVLGGSKNKGKIEAFTQKSKSLNINPEKVGLWQSGAIGIDKKSGKLCYSSELLDQAIHEVDLQSISQCEVKKNYQTENLHQQDISALKSVTLQLKTIQKSEINIPVYDSKAHPYPGDDLLEAMEWAKIISSYIKK
ncbi:MAG: hypothetical protein IPO98_09220 [Saprospiraceae bacterium]|nr:hypothetical protein [Saprospiraceae bacterium]